MSARLAGFTTVAALIGSPAAGADLDLAALRSLMTCFEAPVPTPVLAALIGEGALTGRTGPGFDEDYCWSLAVPHEWEGMTFTSMCVVTGDRIEQAAHPELYWSAALAPWTEVWLLSPAPPEDLDAWAAATLPPGSRYEVDRLVDEADQSALSCSEWHFPPG